MRRIFIIVFFLSCLANNIFSQQMPTLDRAGIKREQDRRNKAKQAKSPQKNTQKGIAKIERPHAHSKKNVVKKRNNSAHPINSLNTALSVSTTSFNATSEETNRYITVYSDIDWYIDKKPSSWVHAYKRGSDLYVSIDKNNASQSRSDCFSICNGYETCNINISQSGKTVTYLNVSSSNMSFSNSGGTQTINVESNRDWYIGVKPSSWVRATKSGNNLYVSVDKNNSTQSRSDYFTINNGDKTCSVRISQTGESPYLNVSTSNISFSSSGGTRTIYVESNCDWKIAVTTAYWGSLSISGNAITLNVKQNNSSSQRTDFFIIKAGGLERKVGITQSASASSYNYSNSSYSNNRSNTTYNYNKSSYSYKSHKSSGPLFSFGIDGDLETNLGSESGSQMYFSVGLLARFGQPKHTLNFITGVRYRWFGDMPSFDNFYDNGNFEWQYFGGIMAIPANFRINVIHIGERSAVYIGVSTEFGVYIADEEYEKSMEKNYMSFSPLLGYSSRHFDISAYWKRYQKGPFVDGVSRYKPEFDSSSMIGLKLGFYF